jgi:hypothetical protein
MTIENVRELHDVYTCMHCAEAGVEANKTKTKAQQPIPRRQGLVTYGDEIAENYRYRRRHYPPR